MTDPDLDDLRSELDDYATPRKKPERSAREERIIAGFQEIQRFVEEYGRVPQHGEDREIFERLYAVRLERIRSLDECRTLVAPLDKQGLLSADATNEERPGDAVDDEELAAELSELGGQSSSISDLRHVRSSAEKRAAEDIANREKCNDFDQFQPLFEQIQQDLDNGVRETRPFEMKAEIQEGRFFIVGGQKAYVATMGEKTLTEQGRTDARLRVIFDNGTESDMLMRSLQRALNKDEAGRRITEPVAGPLFYDTQSEDDHASGTIYVLRSKSDLPVVAQNRDLVHKIGVTNMSVEQRTAGARLQPTFLMADVEVVATYDLYNINRTKLENVIHRIFSPARLDIRVNDRFGNPVVPKEWFLVPLYAIDDAVQKIRDGTISDYIYDPETASLKKCS